MNPLKALIEYGQSVWLDYIRRSLITSGELQRLVDEDEVRGITSNPAIFEKAITGSTGGTGSATDYTEALIALQQQTHLDAKAIYEQLAIHDIQAAADVMRPLYAKTNRRDGYVSLEVAPYLARDPQGTLEEARRLWKAVARENIMIKIPATPEGTPTIQQLISEGININVTLLFSQDAYECVAEAYMAGLEKRAAQGGDVSRVASVASFFVSRIDTTIDNMASAQLKTLVRAEGRVLLQSVMGKVAIANAKLAYQRYKNRVNSPRWQALAAKGAQTQRLLWASTGTKNPAYRDVLYVEELIGPDTVNTMPPSTMDGFRDHGRLRFSLEEDIEGARNILETLDQVGISMKAVTEELLKEGLRLFAEPFDKLLIAVDKKCRVVAWTQLNRQTYTLPIDNHSSFFTALEDWQVNGKVRRLWAQDASLWTRSDESQWLGWLGVADRLEEHKAHGVRIGDEIRNAGFSHALLLGMGGSSLCPEVMAMTFGTFSGYPEFYVLDSTDPAQIKTMEQKLDLANTIFIVSSKSGSTLETNLFKQYFFERVQHVMGAQKAGDRFITITDPGSAMESVAKRDRFRHIFYGVPSIGGRYSALSDFGRVPAALMGINVTKFLDRTAVMVNACSPCVLPSENPGVILGTLLGTLAQNGHDKVTLIASPGIGDLGAWLEQLIAESTGKEGQGLIPVDRERVGPPEVYGNDRVFAYLRLESAPEVSQDAAVHALEQAGQPVVRISVMDPYGLGQEFFRWEIATAVAGSILGVNAFNQPDVEASKVATRALTNAYEQTGSLPLERPLMEEGNIQLFTDDKNASALSKAVGSEGALEGYLRAHLNRLMTGDYFALLAYIEMNEAHEEQLQLIRHAVRDTKRVATCLGFGPRFLHSTGQAYKGGPNTGVFLQITCSDTEDIQVPGQKYTFGIVKAAQARGDFQVLAERHRRILRVHLASDVPAGLTVLWKAVEAALR